MIRMKESFLSLPGCNILRVWVTTLIWDRLYDDLLYYKRNENRVSAGQEENAPDKDLCTLKKS